MGASSQQVLLGLSAPAGDGPPLTNLWSWWDAAEAYTETSGTPTTLITADGTAIGSLKDMSGGGNHLYQATAGAKPTFKTPIINSLPVIRNADGDFMSTNLALPTRPVSVYCVVNRASAWQNLDQIVGGSNTAPRFGILDHTSSPNIACYNGSTFGTDVSMSNAVNHLIAALISDTGSTLRLDAGSDNTAVHASAGNSTFMYLGSYNGGSFWVGDIAEVLIYQATHSMGSGDGLLVRQYLNDKYALGFGI